MNKKLLFAAMSFAALTACSTDDFESQQQVAEGVSPIQFEIINNSETTRASMDGNTLKWNANDGDLFTLYHGSTTDPYTTGYENATYTAQAGENGKAATLTTPSVIKAGKAIMVWPVDTVFKIKSDGSLAISIPKNLDNIENNIPYVSDLINIEDYAPYSEKASGKVIPTAYKTAGKDRKYKAYMRPMASQLILKADYAGTDAKINALATGADPIEPIALTSVDLTSGTANTFTESIALKFTAATGDDTKRWADTQYNTWSHVTGFNTGSTTTTDKLTTTCINGLESAKFLILPQAELTTAGMTTAAVTVNTIYGKVVIGEGTKYKDEESKAAWYRYQKAGADKINGETETEIAGTGDDAGKVRFTNYFAKGLGQVINAFSKNTTTKDGSLVKTEPTGAVGTRYVKVLLDYLDMDGLHIKNDKHLYDAVRVWKEIGKGSVRVLLDGTKNEFEISQKTIAKINEINAATAKETPARTFTVMPCNDHPCDIIVITGGDEIAQNLTFIQRDATLNKNKQAGVALKAGENWKWNSKNVMVDATATGVESFINRGTLVSNANATLKIFDNSSADPKNPKQISSIKLTNDGEWNITAGAINVQFNVTNNGTVNIAQGAEYRQDMADAKTTFTNDAQTVPVRFYMNDPKTKDKNKFVEKIGKVNNEGVFAALASRGQIFNYGLIEHADKDAKTYITTNELGTAPVFASAFKHDADVLANNNKMGRINLPFSNKDEDNISISAEANQGFVSVTVTSDNAPEDKKLDASKVGKFVNYVIINSGIEEVTNINAQVKYIEFNDKDKKEIAWMPRYTDKGVDIEPDYTYEGLVVFSPVNIKLNTTVQVKSSAFLAANIYVAGKLNNGTDGIQPNWNGYFGQTADNAATMYITFK